MWLELAAVGGSLLLLAAGSVVYRIGSHLPNPTPANVASAVFATARSVANGGLQAHFAAQRSSYSNAGPGTKARNPDMMILHPDGSKPNVPKWKSLLSDYSDRADMAVVYIQEAHPSDGWTMGAANGKYDVPAPKLLEERIGLARTYVADHGLTAQPVAVDLMEDEAMKMYTALPERLYVIEDGHVAFQGGIGPHSYDVDACRKWLEQRFKA